MKQKLVLTLFILALIVVAAVKILGDRPASETRRQNLPAVSVQKPARELIVQRIQLTGDVLPVRQANIFSKVSGTLDQVYANIGSVVKPGQALALIDTTELAQQVQQMQATYYNARISFQRTQQLLERNLVSKQDLDNAEALMKVAEANFDNARTRLGYALITAPFGGYITKRYMDAGAVVTTPTNATLFTLMDYDTVKVSVNILEKDLPLVHLGTRATIAVDAFPGKELTGTVARMSEAIDLSTRTMTAEIDIPNRNLLLRPGMYAKIVLLVAERPDQITVPTQSLLRDDNGYSLFTATGGVAHRVQVTVGVEQGGRTEILSGLKGDEEIIVLGQTLVKDGGQVIIK